MEKQICLKSTQLFSPLAPSQTFITEDCFPNSKESSTSFASFDEPPIFLVEKQPNHWGTYDIDEPSPVPATANIPYMSRAEEGLHCFWDEDTGFEVLLVQVILIIRCGERCKASAAGGIWRKTVLGRASEGDRLS